MDLFDTIRDGAEIKPLAERMRANTLKEFLRQEHIVSESSLLNRAIRLDRLGSCIFWGPPGVGKTTLAKIIANTTQSRFITFSAVTSGINEIRQVMQEA